MSGLKSIALVGRPNVGKSRLFNRLLGRRVSIVHDRPGVTRDIVAEKLSDGILLMDTGGMFASPGVSESVIIDATNRQAAFAVGAADAVIFVVDSQEGLTPLDLDIAKLLRDSGKPVVLAINKVDVPEHSDRNSEFYALGFRDCVEVSAEHGAGVEDLAALIERDFGEISPPEDEGAGRIKICVAGRPNVGKSSIANRLLGGDKLIVSQVAGTTRDAVKFDLDFAARNGETLKFRLYDTAGLKAKSKTNTSLDFLSSLRARRAVEGCDIVFLVLDCMGGVTELDKRLAGEIMEAGASIIVVVNKWDIAEAAFAKRPLRGYENIREFGAAFDESVRKIFNFIGDSRVYFVSALENRGVGRLLEAAGRMRAKMNAGVPTGRLNKIVRELMERNPPKYVSGKRFKAYYCVKTGSRPYTVRMYCNDAGALSTSYEKYLVNGLRAALKLGGVAIRLEPIGKPAASAAERVAGRSAE